MSESPLHAAAVKTFETFVEAAEIAGVPFMLFDGTLLGAIRDRDFCEGDEDDIDIAVTENHWTRLAGLTEGLWFRVVDRWIYRENVENIKLQLCDTPVTVDIRRLHYHRDREEVYNVGHVTIGGERVFVANVYPAYHFRYCSMIEFQGRRVRVPNDPANLLELRYGRDWRTPVHRNVWDWPAKVEGNLCVRANYDELSR